MKDKGYILKKFTDISHLIQKEFDRNIEKYGDKIKCRKGCSRCCHQIFRITMADAYVIKTFLNSKPELKNSLKEKAAEYIEKNISFDKSETDFFSNPKLPCPALNKEGECLIYDSRPVICRRFGPPIYNYKNPGKLYACELNFTEGEEIVDDQLIPHQTTIGLEWDNLKTVFNTKFSLNEITSTTIAEAILNS